MDADTSIAPVIRLIIQQLRTDPETTGTWAEYYDCHPRTMQRILRQLEKQQRAWKIGDRWQLALSAAPLSYNADGGFRRLAVEISDAVELGHFRTTLEARSSIAKPDGSAKESGSLEFMAALIDALPEPAEVEG
jgi:hypothetical protein